MEKDQVKSGYRYVVFALILLAVGGLAFAAGVVLADDTKPKVVYPKHTELDFEGLRIEGEIKNPGEFYFQHRNEEKFDSLVKRRKDFHRQMLRDAVLSK
jgi:hypothetical protein